MSTRVAIIGDPELIRAGHACVLESSADCRVVLSTDQLTSVDDVSTPVDVVLWRYDPYGDRADLDVLTELCRRGAKAIVIGDGPRPLKLGPLLDAGAVGYVSFTDPPSALVRIFEAAVAGKDWTDAAMVARGEATFTRPELSPQELTAARLYVTGITLDAVARRMAVGSETAKTYLNRARGKYGAVGRPVRTRMELYLALLEDGALDHQPPDEAEPE